MKSKKKNNKHKILSASQLDKLHDSGKDMSKHMKKTKNKLHSNKNVDELNREFDKHAVKIMKNNTPKFKIGNIVVVTSDRALGRVGRIDKVYPANIYNQDIGTRTFNAYKLAPDDYNMLFDESELRLASSDDVTNFLLSEVANLKKEKSVMTPYINPYFPYCTKSDMIRDIDKRVICDKLNYNKAPKFKPGDKVSINHLPNRLYYTVTEQVLYYGEFGWKYTLEFNNGYKKEFIYEFEKNLTLINNCATKFKEGDKVKLVRGFGDENAVFVINRSFKCHNSDELQYEITQFDQRDLLYCHRKVVSESALEPIVAKFKVGELVCSYKSTLHGAKMFEIKDVKHDSVNGEICYFSPSGHEYEERELYKAL